MIQVGDKLKDGLERDVRIIAVDCMGPWPVVGLVTFNDGDNEGTAHYTAEGKSSSRMPPHDLVLPPKGIFKVEVKLYGTLYVRAESVEDAVKQAWDTRMLTLTLPDDTRLYGEVWASGRKFDDPALPDVSFSPVFTVQGPDDDSYAWKAD